MPKLELFVDPYESEYPSLVRETLSQCKLKNNYIYYLFLASRKSNICSSLTSHNQCVLIANNVMYIWVFNNKVHMRFSIIFLKIY